MSTQSPPNESLTLAKIQEQEDTLQFTRFTNEDAWDLGVELANEARRRNAAMAIDINRGGQQLFHVGLPGTSPDNDAWLARKGRVVMRFGHSSLYIGQLCRDQGTTFEERYGLSSIDYVAKGGGFPLRVKDVGVIGFVAVSGLPELDDHRLLVGVLERFLAH